MEAIWFYLAGSTALRLEMLKERSRNHKNLIAPALKGGGFCGFCLGSTKFRSTKYQIPSTKFQPLPLPLPTATATTLYKLPTTDHRPQTKFQAPSTKFQIPLPTANAPPNIGTAHPPHPPPLIIYSFFSSWIYQYGVLGRGLGYRTLGNLLRRPRRLGRL